MIRRVSVNKGYNDPDKFFYPYFSFYSCNDDIMTSFRIYNSITKINYKHGEKGIWEATRKVPFHSRKFKQSWRFIFILKYSIYIYVS